MDIVGLRAEFRGLSFGDRFDFGQGEESYMSMYWFGQIGLTFKVF